MTSANQPDHRLILLPWLKPAMSLLVRDWLAITIGHTIFAARPLSEDELRHELVHVAQWQTFGPLFVFRYAWASVVAWRATGHPYRDNRYEVEARGE